MEQEAWPRLRGRPSLSSDDGVSPRYSVRLPRDLDAILKEESDALGATPVSGDPSGP